MKEILKSELKRLKRAVLNKMGLEVSNPQPLRLHCGVQRPPTLEQQINRVLKARVSREAHESGFETEEEANDFTMDEPFDQSDPNTIYQVLEDELPLQEDPPPEPIPEEIPATEPTPEPVPVDPAPETS